MSLRLPSNLVSVPTELITTLTNDEQDKEYGHAVILLLLQLSLLRQIFLRGRRCSRGRHSRRVCDQRHVHIAATTTQTQAKDLKHKYQTWPWLGWQVLTRRGSAVVSTSACHAGGQGSLPGPGTLLGVKTWLSTLEIVYRSLCLSDETLKAVGPLYLVSMPGEVKDPTSLHWKCVTCRGLHDTTL